MDWMWIAGPLLLALIFMLTGGRDKRREAEIERWRTEVWPSTDESEHLSEEGGHRKAQASTAKSVDASEPSSPKRPGPRRIGVLPGPLQRMLDAAGGGHAIGHFELVPKLAYLSTMASSATSGSDHQTVTAKLEEAAPSFLVRPLPILEGERIANSGVEFKKDPDFMSLFLVEATTPSGTPSPAMKAETTKRIRAWLSRPLRDALRELPDAWLWVQGKTMAVTLYGHAEASRLNDLVALADIIFAEHGGGGGPSLFGIGQEDEEEEAAPPKKRDDASKKAKKTPGTKGASEPAA